MDKNPCKKCDCPLWEIDSDPYFDSGNEPVFCRNCEHDKIDHGLKR